MQKLFSKQYFNPYFLYPYLFFLLLGAIILLNIDKGEEVVALNKYHNIFFDHFFYYATALGNGWIFAAITISLLFYRIRWALVAALSFLTTTIIIQLAKAVLNEPRPKAFLTNFEELHRTLDVVVHSYGSFPSGHTTTAFAIATILSLLLKKPWGALWFVIACFVAISRIYLLQHFLIDVYMGSIAGFLSSTIWYYVFKNYWLNVHKLDNAVRLKRSSNKLNTKNKIGH